MGSEIICRTPYVASGIQMSVFDDGVCLFSHTLQGAGGEQAMTTTSHIPREAAVKFIQDAAEILGLFVSEQPAVGAGR